MTREDRLQWALDTWENWLGSLTWDFLYSYERVEPVGFCDFEKKALIDTFDLPWCHPIERFDGKYLMTDMGRLMAVFEDWESAFTLKHYVDSTEITFDIIFIRVCPICKKTCHFKPSRLFSISDPKKLETCGNCRPLWKKGKDSLKRAIGRNIEGMEELIPLYALTLKMGQITKSRKAHGGKNENVERLAGKTHGGP
jgi:hypothetical protein